ncbi:MAG: hypothetical protein IPF98_04130 [Gemmatimonadetes bacterium]|nr:hypothetical protein [Gemmatimonadota bacterium]
MGRTHLHLGLALAALLTAACSDRGQDEPTSPLTARAATEIEHAVVLSDSGVGAFGEHATISPSGGVGTTGLATPGIEPYACDSFGAQWGADWKAALLGKTKYRAAAFAHQYAGTYTTYPGAHVYNGTNTNSKTYLGACNGDATDVLVVRIERRISGTWKVTQTVSVMPYQKFTFYSGIPAAYRMKTYSANANVVEHYGIGAGWTISPGLTLGSP